MKPIKMTLNTESGRQAIETKLNEVQSRAKARTLSLFGIELALSHVESNLDIPKCKLDGVTVHYTGAEHFPGAYKGIPESTHFRAIHNGKRWEITEIYRSICPNNTGRILITLTEQAKQAVLDRVTKIE